MKKKIIDFVIDILLIMLVLAVTEFLLLNVLQSESFWLEFGIYCALYIIAFGCKKGIGMLWRRLASKRNQAT